MKKLLAATILGLGMVGAQTAVAGGLQLQPAGNGAIGGSKFLTGLGNSLGDFLASGLARPGNQGALYGHNFIPISSDTVPGGGELTFVFGVNAVSSPVGSDSVAFSDGAPAFAPGHSYFEMFWRPGAGSGHNANLGTGYDDDVWLASGHVQIDVTQGAGLGPGFGSGGPLSATGTGASLVDSVALGGNATLNVEFVAQNDLYVVNTLSVATIDLFISDVLAAPYINAPASDHVGGSGGLDANSLAAGMSWIPGGGIQGDTILGNTGNGINDLLCGGLGGAGVCNVQAQMNSTLSFNARRVPEPTSLALAGAALALAGFGSARKRKQQA